MENNNNPGLINRHDRRRHKALERRRVKQTRRQQPRLRTALLASAAVGVLATANLSEATAQVALNPPGAIPAQCTVIGGSAICEGDLSAGIDADGPPLNSLTLQNLTAGIAPAANVDGINFRTTNGNITIDVDGTGTAGIVTTTAGAATDGDGIDAEVAGNGSITVTNNANIATAAPSGTGIYTYVSGDGNITVVNSGNIETVNSSSDGIVSVIKGNGNILVDNSGVLNIASFAIYSKIDGNGDIAVTSTRDVSATTFTSIFLYSNGSGSITLNQTGDVHGGEYGVYARNRGAGGDSTVTVTGNVTAVDEQGIYVGSANGNANLNVTGNVTAARIGVNVVATSAGPGIGNAHVVINGNVTSANRSAIDVSGYNSVTIESTGDVIAGQSGIRARQVGTGTTSIRSIGAIRAGDDAFDLGVTGNGNIDLTSKGDLTATNTGAHGIDADVAANGNITLRSDGRITSQGPGIAATIGGTGAITITSSGHVITNGNNAEGIEANITGNGAVNIVSDGNVTTNGTGSEGIRGYVAGAGNVTITSRGDIVVGSGTYGEGIEGYIGGNGNVSINSVGNISVASDEGIFGYVVGNGNVTIVSRGNITTPVDEEGIDAYVVGSGHVVVSSVGNIISEEEAIRATVNGTGSITVDSTGNLTALDPGQHGLQVRNYGGGSSVVTILGGTITGGGGAADGVNFRSLAGSNNTLNIRNSVTISSIGGTAIEGSNGNDTINNFGTLNTVTNGAIELGAGTNAFNNKGGAIFNSGGIVNLGAGNIFSNSGILSPGASGTIQTTAITGTVVQGGGGIFLASVDPSAGTGDLVTVTETATLAGNVQAHVINPAFGNQSVTILSAAGGTTNNGLGLLASPALQASLTFPNANDVVLTYSIDFSAGGLNPNQTALAGSLNSAVAAGVGGLEPVLDPLLNNIFTVGDYQNALNQLLPEVALNNETATLFASEGFVDNLFSCRLAGQNHTILSESECYWARPQGRVLDRDSDANTIGFDETSGGLAAGAQVAVAPNWFAGFALGYERASLDTDTGAETDSNRFSGGLSLKYQAGSFLLGAAISGGVSGNDTKRPISFGGAGGFNATADSNYAIKTLTGQARAAYVFQFRDWFAKPLVDVTATYLSRDGVTETGAGAANLAIAGSDETFFSITPALEIGGDFALSETSVIRPYVRAGVSFYTDSDHGLTASFVNAPTGTGAFSINSSFDDVFADVAAGATAFFDNGSSLGLAYEGLISSDTQQHGISVKGTLRF